MDNKELLDDLKRLSLDEIATKYDLTLNELFKLTKQLHSSAKGNNNKYVSRTRSGSYNISKSLNGVNEYFGSYKKKKEALLVRDELIKCGWDKEKLPEILIKLNIKSKCGDGKK